MAEVQKLNNCDRPLHVPGFNSLPIYLELHREERFTHGSAEWVQEPNVTARELAILQLINDITDKPEWHSKAFESKILVEWREESLLRPLINERAWRWCLKELQDKAKLFEESERVLVMNIGSGICKSDKLLTANLKAELKEGIAPLVADADTRWVSKAYEQELALLDPSLFPLIYGKTRVLTTGGAVSLDGATNSCGQGNIAPDYSEDEWNEDAVGRPTLSKFWTFDEYSLFRFSKRFQWLPFDVKFTDQSSCAVCVTSYINNLHPVRFNQLYHTIEKLISATIDPWNDILIKGEDDRWPRRINTWGLPWRRAEQDWPSDETLLELEKDRNSSEFKHMVNRIREFLSLPESPPDLQVPGWFTRSAAIPLNWQSKDGGLSEAIDTKWNRLYSGMHPEVGLSFSYEQWKAGDTGNAIFSGGRPPWGDQVPRHEYYSIALQKEFREKGLQIIAKITSIDLTPEQPAYNGGFWQLEATLNEHIVATTAFFYDAKNVTDSRISFRQQTKMDDNDFIYASNDFDQLVEVFAIPEEGGNGPAYQDLGSITTPEGRLLAWPNTLHYRIEPFELVNITQPGHQRFIILYLVDPNYRICSTKNVPPQQHDWWAKEALTSTGFAQKGMPQEILDHIERETGEWPMGMEEARKLREEIEEDRVDRVEKTNNYSELYMFADGDIFARPTNNDPREGYGKARQP